MIIHGLRQIGRPIIILDLEGEEWPARGFDRILRVGDDENPLALNALEMNFSEDAGEESEIATQVFTESLGLSPGQSQILWETFRLICRQREVEDKEMRRHAISSIIAEIQRNTDPQRIPPESPALLRKLVLLAEGKIGKALNQGNPIKIGEILKGTTLVELREVADLQARKLLLSLILVSLTQHVKTRVSEEQDHPLFLVLKEGGSILEEDEVGHSILRQSLLELGKRGINLLIIQASPRIAPPYLLDRCQTRIFHRLTNRGDIDLAQRILNLDESQTILLQEMSSKEALVKTPEHIQPVLTWIPGSVSLTTERAEKASPHETDLLEIVSEPYENEIE